MDGREFLKRVGQATRYIERRILNAIVRGALERVDDSTKMQVVQATLLDGEVKSQLERIQQYGFTSVPPVGSECVVLFMNGNRDHGVVIAAEDRAKRKKDMAEGDVAIYNGENPASHYILIDASTGQTRIYAPGRITIHSDDRVDIEATNRIHLDAPNITTSCGTICP